MSAGSSKDGSLVLIDYKSGTVQTDWLGERPQNPQLPIYALSVNGPVTALAYGRVSSGECRFMGVSERADILPQVNAKTLEGLGMSGQLILWADRLALLAGELSNGDARVKPSKNACRNCTLPAFCRIAEQPDAVADADDPEGGEHAL